MIGGWPEELDGGDHPAVGAVAERESVFGPVELLEAAADVGQTDAFAAIGAVGGAQPRTVVGHLQQQVVGIAIDRDDDATDPVVARHAVTDGVFHQWLQNEARHHGVEAFGVDVDKN